MPRIPGIVEDRHLLVDAIRRRVGSGVRNEGNFLAVAGLKPDAWLTGPPEVPDASHVSQHHPLRAEGLARKRTRMENGESAAAQEQDAPGEKHR